VIPALSPNADRFTLSADTITYFTTMVGVIRAGYVAFLISPRNSPAALAHLLSSTNPAHVLLGTEQPLQNLFAASLELMAEGSALKRRIRSSNMPTFEEIYISSSANDAAFQPLPPFRPDLDTPAIILHSSGPLFPSPYMQSY
jgi:acyl-CoA synthetase (AMP-forming)/AMP-acid ligase II